MLSSSSARSEICAWEVEEAARLNKRILPIICRPLEGVSPPPRLQGLNYMFFYEEPKLPGSGFGKGLAILVEALNTDLDWLREHTRYLQRAIEWDSRNRPANRLLSGDDIAEAKAWAARRPKSAPEPTVLHLDFIRASENEAEVRASQQRMQFEEVAAAQAARESALHDREEAVKQAAEAQQQAKDAQRRRARIRNIALVAVSILALLAVLLGWRFQQERIVAEQQKEEAERQRETAEKQRTVAEQQQREARVQRDQADGLLAYGTNIILNSYDRLNYESQKSAVTLFEFGAKRGDSTSMSLLGRIL